MTINSNFIIVSFIDGVTIIVWHFSSLQISLIACISLIANRSVFIQIVKSGEHTGGEDDTNHLQQGQAETDRSNQ